MKIAAVMRNRLFPQVHGIMSGLPVMQVCFRVFACITLMILSEIILQTGIDEAQASEPELQLNAIGNQSVAPGNLLSFVVNANGSYGQTPTFGVGIAPDPDLYVSTTGSDSNPGTLELPFKSFERARAEVRSRILTGLPRNGITVWVRGGIHERSAPLLLGAGDSGPSAEQPVRWRAYPGEKVRISGGRSLSGSQLALVTSASPVWNRLDASARGQVRQVDLKPILGITAESTTAQTEKAYGVLRQRGFGRYQEEYMPAMELFVDGQPLRLARWPDHDAHLASPTITGSSFTIHGAGTPSVSGTFVRTASNADQVTFTRQGLVDGKQYYLWGHRWVNGSSGDTGWNYYISTTANPNPNGNPRWQSYGDYEPLVFYPNESEGASGWLRPRDPDQPLHGFVHTLTGTGNAPFGYAGDRPARWIQAPDAWVDGFWNTEYAENHYPIAAINTSTKKISLPLVWDSNRQQNLHPEIKPMHPWYAYNLLEEITQAGEWYLDRFNGILYVWPPNGFSSSSEVTISMLEGALIDLQGASHIAFSDLTLEASRYQLIRAQNSHHLTFHQLTLRNSGGSAAEIIHCNTTALSRSRILDCGHSAIWISGGNRDLLTSSGNVIEDCEIARYGRFQFSGVHAIMVEGCGVTIQHNHIHSAPDRAIGYSGNDHLIAYNDIHDVSRFCADAAAIYTGRWDTRGTLIRHNFIHHLSSLILGSHTHGVYVDDGGAASKSEGNVFYAISGYALKFNGGRENEAVNNIMVRCGSSLAVTTRANQMPEENNGINIRLMLGWLNERPYRTGIWASRYPKCAQIPNTYEAVVANRDTWLLPREGVFERNIVWQSANGWIYGLNHVKAYFTNGQNVETSNLTNSNPLFVNEADLDLRLRPESPAFNLPGFQSIPFEDIGIRPE
jgi:hypothetical protein